MKHSRRKRWPCVHLCELVAFWKGIYGEDLTLDVLSHAIGVSPQVVSAMMVRDDAKMSTVQQMVRASGYVLSFTFKGRPEWEAAVNRTAVKWPDAGLLSGLAKLMAGMNRTVNSAAVMSGVSRDILYRAFKTGDIKVSQLLALTEGLGIDVKWAFLKLSA